MHESVSMSTDSTQQPNEDSGMGITFINNAPRDGEKSPGGKAHLPSPEDIVKDSASSRQGGVFNVSEAFEAKHELGTIVTDRRKSRTSLGDNLQSAFTEWWGGVKKTTAPALTAIKAPKKEEEAKIPRAETRAPVIESAATNAMMAPKDDHHVVIEKVKTFRRDVERVTGVPFTVKEAPKKAEGGTSGWTHTIDETKKSEPRVSTTPHRPTTPPDLRASMVAPVVVKHIEKDITDFYKRETPKKEAAAPRRATSPNQIAYMHIPGTVEKRPDPIERKTTPVAPVVQPAPRSAPEAVAPVPEKRENLGYVAKVRHEAPVKPLREGPAEGVPMPELPTREATDESLESEFHGSAREETVVEKLPERPRAPRSSGPTLGDKIRIGLFWAALPTAAILGVVLAVIVNTGGDAPSEETGAGTRETVSVAPEKIFDVDAQTAIPVTDRQTFMSTLGQMISTAPSGVNQFYPTLDDGTSVRLLTAEDFFMNLRVGLPESAIRSLADDFVIGSVTTTKNEPFILLRSANFDALFAGMLAWEPRLRRDLSPLFDDTYVDEDIFTDGVRENRAVRILYDALGGEALLYAFIDKNTLVITSSVEALSVIIDEL